ncbi:MAG: ATP-binding protein [Planctomycetota bacterium]|nr:ATP-binding protein [Planctomycetota bacterium]
MRFEVENFQRYKDEGLAALKSGNRDRARFCLLKAAEFLFKMAAESSGSLRAIRTQNAQKLLSLAKNLPRHPKTTRKAYETDEEGAAEDKFIVKERPDVSFDDIAGLEEAKREIMVKVVHPLKFPDLARRFGMRLGGGVLFYGPPGTGKTMLAKATAKEVNAPFYTVRPSELLSKWVGESEKNIAQLFENARSHPLSVVFIDEVEALIPRRTTTYSTVMARVVPQFLSELEGFHTSKQNPILFIGATNEPWLLDPAVLRPGRFDERIYIGLPDKEARRKIFELNLRNRPLADDVNFDSLAEKTEGYSGADIRNICDNAAESLFLEAVSTQKERSISMSDLLAILTKTKPSVTPQMLERYERYKNLY